jgi:hypothetical protein
MMIAALVGGECDCDQNEHDNEDHPLFIRREFENSEQPFHQSSSVMLSASETSLDPVWWIWSSEIQESCGKI